MSGEKLGVLLVQLGGPERRDELKPFLYELFVDPEILNIRFAPLRKLVAWIIATVRAPKSAEI
ncbi:MAG TPA: ferrochelatase, partial [Thermoanaerobaculia bacterium]|nr:ferrochelatase [Thermoanaerobaculia bacterium]